MTVTERNAFSCSCAPKPVHTDSAGCEALQKPCPPSIRATTVLTLPLSRPNASCSATAHSSTLKQTVPFGLAVAIADQGTQTQVPLGATTRVSDE